MLKDDVKEVKLPIVENETKKVEVTNKSISFAFIYWLVTTIMMFGSLEAKGDYFKDYGEYNDKPWKEIPKETRKEMFSEAITTVAYCGLIGWIQEPYMIGKILYNKAYGTNVKTNKGE